jgi:hypothetical protein
MHQATEKDFKKEQGGGKCTGACLVLLVIQARSLRYQNRNSCLSDVPQVVVVVVLSSSTSTSSSFAIYNQV